ncbi:MAG: hypothetical protein IKK99_00270 [Oscillospiraceae bacterium]|nr:hypothetical protein [Oscillospiraceae bacterium]
MAGFWDTIKKGFNAVGNAGSAWQETQKTMYTAPVVNKPQVNNQPAVNNTPVLAPSSSKQPTEEDKKIAQAYAQAALNGTSGIYVPESQTANAMINAQVPINPVASGGSTGGGLKGSTGGNSAGTTVGGVSPTDAIYSAYAQAQAQQEALYKQQDDLYKQQEELAAKQRDDLKATLLAQNEAAKKQREAALNASLDANNQAADKSLKEAYIAYMLGKRNMPQELKAMGISGGATETTLADAHNTYMNNRFGIEEGRNDANAIARRDYDTGVNSDYVDYLAAVSDVDNDYANRMYALMKDKNGVLLDRASDAVSAGRSLASNLASAGKTSGSKTSTKTTTKSSSSGDHVEGVRIGNNQTVHTSGASLLKELYDLGFTEAQAREYLKNAGIM